MNPRTKLLTLALLLIASTASAQRAIVLELPTGKSVAFIYLPNGETLLITEVQHLRFPNPTPPPATATRAIVLLESGDSSVETTILRAKIRQNESLSKRIEILDPDTEDQNGNPDPSVAKAKVLIGGRPLPFVIGFDGRGEAVVAEPLPLDFAKFQTLVKGWGLQ